MFIKVFSVLGIYIELVLCVKLKIFKIFEICGLIQKKLQFLYESINLSEFESL